MKVDIAQVLGDIFFLGSFLVIIISIERKKSCAGWSGRMQILILFTLVTRYWMILDPFTTLYEVITKGIWILLSAYTIYLIYIKYSKTYEKRCDTFWIESIILSSLAGALVFCPDISVPELTAWLFSWFNESLSILPQCYFAFLSHKKDVAVTYYVGALLHYRLMYIVHWNIEYIDSYMMYPGISQLALYIIYFLLPKGKPYDVEEGQPPVLRNVPTYLTQESLLETPLLKRSATSSSSIFIIGDNCSDSSSLHRSISTTSEDNDGRY